MGLPAVEYAQWMAAQRLGGIREDPRTGGYYLDFRKVRFPGGATRRVRIYSITEGVPIGPNRELAEKLLSSIRAQVEGGKTPAQALAKFLGENSLENRFGTHWQRYVDAREQDVHDGDLSRQRWNELRHYEARGYLTSLWTYSIFGITTGVLDDWRRALLRRKSIRGGALRPKTVRNVVNDVAGFLRWLKRRGDLSHVPDIPTIRIREPYQPRIPSERTVQAILEAIPEPKRGIFLARASMGLRPSEARRLNLSSWDREQNVLRLTLTKTGATRILPLDADVREWLEWFYRDPPLTIRPVSTPLFSNPNTYARDRRWTPSAERRVWLAACKEVGVRVKPNEGGRHAFATHAAKRGVQQFPLQKFMGHTDPRTTGRYIDLSAAGLIDVLRRRGNDG